MGVRTVVIMASALTGGFPRGLATADPGSNTPLFATVPSVLAIFAKSEQNARDIRKTWRFNGAKQKPQLLKSSKNQWKIAKIDIYSKNKLA